jgi:hypothetical protein
MRKLLPTLLLLSAAGPAAAFHPLITDDTGTQGKGRSQVELAVEIGRDECEEGEHRREAGAATFAHGLGDSLDLQAALPYERAELSAAEGSSRSAGAGDAALEAKWRFFERGGLSLAWKPGFTAPTGDAGAGLGSGRVTGRSSLLATMRWPRFALHANAGYVYNANHDDERLHLWRFSAAAEAQVAGRWKAVADAGAARDVGAGPDPVFVMAGLVYSPAPWIDVDAGLKRGVVGTEERVTALFGTTLRF